MEYFFKLGLSLLTQRRRQDLPVRWRRPLERMELQSLGPYLLTWLIRTSSSSAFHGPFFISSLSTLSIPNFIPFFLSLSIFLFYCLTNFLCNFSLFFPGLVTVNAVTGTPHFPLLTHIPLFFSDFKFFFNLPSCPPRIFLLAKHPVSRD